MELTKEFFQETIKDLATKKDLERLAPKDYLVYVDLKADGLNTKVDQKFKHLHKFLNQNMLTKTEFEEIRKELADKTDIDRVLTSIDGIAKQMNIYNAELPAITLQIKNINDWIQEASKKIGIKYRT